MRRYLYGLVTIALMVFLGGCEIEPLKLKLYGSSQEMNITDNHMIVSTAEVNDTRITGIEELMLTLIIDHEQINDLTVTLESPTGTRATVMKKIITEHNGEFDVHFKMEAKAEVPIKEYDATWDTAGGVYLPEESFSRFVGENPEGTWKIKILDNHTLHTGKLKGWLLFFN